MTMTADANTPKSSTKPLLITLVCIVLVAGLAFAGYKVFESRAPKPLSPKESREAIQDYLKKKGHRSDFQTSLDAIKKDKHAWDTLAKQYDSVADYETVYRLIGEHLWIADQFIKSSEKKEQRAGVRIVMGTADMAQDVAVDDWLACRICDGYLVPLFESDEKLTDEDEQLVRFAYRKYADADDKESEIALEKLYLSKAGSSRRADWVRYRLVRLLESVGRHDEAQQVRSQIGAATDSSKTNLSPKKIEKLQKMTNAATAKN